MSRNTLNTLVGLLFIISGAVGLVYQIVWFKYLSLFLGNTTYAQSIVLATFMGGLALGAARWGRKADQSANHLSLYAMLELGIGVYCFMYPLILRILKSLFVQIVVGSHISSDATTVLILKLVVCIITLLPPTILMGGTLPVLVRFISLRLEDSGKNVATLYFLNSFGAVVGSLLAGFILIRVLGLSGTIYGAASVNLIVALSAYLLSRRSSTRKRSTLNAGDSDEVEFSSRSVLIATLVAAVSGFAAMIYELSWVRLLIPVLGSSTYSFSLMLVAFISGITIGSIIVSALLLRVKNLFILLGMCQLAVALSMLLTLPLYARIPYYFWNLASILSRSETTYPLFLALELAFAFALMVVPTIFLGMSLPVATRIASRRFDTLGRTVGNVFSLNTLGTVIGSLASGLFLIPWIGVKHTIEVGVLFNIMAGLAVIFSDSASGMRKKTLVGATTVLAVVAYFSLIPNWSRGAMLSGVFRTINRNVAPPKTYAEFASTSEKTKVLYYKEGIAATVGVIEGEVPEGKQEVLIINGKADASSRGDLPTEVLLGQLPALFHPNPRKALVIGFGSGVTVGSILKHPVEQVDCVEISPEVIEASSIFEHVNNRPLQDRRTRLYIEDALAFLNLTDESYDMIVSEPSNPWIAGIGNLYTEDFFKECKRHLLSNGIMVQWFHLYEMNDETFRLVLRTFQSSFPNVTLWQPLAGDVIMMGSETVLDLDLSRLQSAMNEPGAKEDCDRIQIPDCPTLLSLQMVSELPAVRYAAFGELNTQDHPRLEYAAPEAFFINRGVSELNRFDQRMRFEDSTLLMSKRIRQKPLTDAEVLNIGMLHAQPNRGNSSLGYSMLAKSVKRNPRNIRALRQLADVSERLRRTEESIHFRKQLAEMQPDNPDVLEAYAWSAYTYERSTANALSALNTAETERYLRQCIKLSADSVDRYRARLADLFFGTQRYAKAMDQYARALQIRGDHVPDVRIRQDILLLRLAQCLHQLGKDDRASGYALQATWVNPENDEAKDLIYEIWMAGGTGKK